MKTVTVLFFFDDSLYARARKNAKPDKTPASNLKEALTLGGALFEREVHVELCGNREAMIDGC